MLNLQALENSNAEEAKNGSKIKTALKTATIITAAALTLGCLSNNVSQESITPEKTPAQTPVYTPAITPTPVITETPVATPEKPLPDFKITNISYSKKPRLGDDIHVLFKAVNLGGIYDKNIEAILNIDGKTEDRINFYLEKDSQKEIAFPLSHYINSDKKIDIVIDPHNDIAESDKSNNILSAYLNITKDFKYLGEKYKDLKVTFVDIDSEQYRVKSGQNIVVAVGIKNDGTEKINEFFDITLYYREFGSNNMVAHQTKKITKSLEPGEEMLVKFGQKEDKDDKMLSFTRYYEAGYEIIAFVNSDGGVNEIFEQFSRTPEDMYLKSNNIKGIPVIVEEEP